MTRLGAIVQFQRKFPREESCIVVAEHRGSYTAVIEESEEHKRFLTFPHNTYKKVNVKEYLIERLRDAGCPEDFIKRVSQERNLI